MKKTKGFTLVELIIVIVIVGILSIVAVPIYRGYTKKAIGSEAKALLGSIATSEKVYFAEFGEYWLETAATSFSVILDIDARANKYFQTYTVENLQGNTPGFTATAIGVGAATGLDVTLEADSEGLLKTSSAGLDA